MKRLGFPQFPQIAKFFVWQGWGLFVQWCVRKKRTTRAVCGVEIAVMVCLRGISAQRFTEEELWARERINPIIASVPRCMAFAHACLLLVGVRCWLAAVVRDATFCLP